MEPDEYQKLLEKYKEKVKAEFGEKAATAPQVTSKEYSEFKQELYPTRYSLYEKACNLSESILKLKPDPAKAVAQQKNIDTCHLNITPGGVTSFAILAALFTIVVGSLVSFALPVLFGAEPMFFFVIFFLIAGISLLFALQNLPSFM